jgi:hypothetical protein
MPLFRDNKHEQEQDSSKERPLCDDDVDDAVSTTSSKRSTRSRLSSLLLLGGGRKKGRSSKKCRSQKESSQKQINNEPPTLCCNFCDMRIATVLLNVLHLGFSTLLEILYISTNNWMIDEPPMLCLLAVVFSGLGVFGGLHFNLMAMYTSTVGLVMLFFMYLKEVHIFGLGLVCGCIFVHTIFIHELRQGVLTKDNYTEKEYIDETGRDVIQSARSFASDAADTTKELVRTTSTTIAEVLVGGGNEVDDMTENEEDNKTLGKVREEC